MHFSDDLNFLSFTIQPNHIYDFFMKHLSGVQYKIVSAICRKTYGWVDEKGNRKTEDAISISQFEEITGCSRSTINEALQFLTHHKIIIKRLEGEIGSQIGVYGLGPFREDDYKRLSKVFHKDTSKSSNNIYPPSTKIVPPPSTKIVPTKETKEINKKEPTSLPPSSAVGSTAVVKAPAQRTLAPDPLAKTVASAPKPSQSSACSKIAPPGGDAKSVAGAPSGELLFLLNKYKKENNNVDVDEKLFKQAYDEMKDSKGVDNPYAYLKKIFVRLKEEYEASKVKESLAVKHRWLAAQCCGEGTGGSRFIEGNFYVRQSGSFTTKYEFGIEDKIWSELEEIVKRKGTPCNSP